MFSILRPYIFSLDPEVAHDLAIKSLKANFLPKSLFSVENEEMLETSILGKTISNPIGLAAGFDKSAEVYNSLFKFGFGFVEVGTVTPKQQLGNPKPRIFRLEKDQALINRLGFNNHGSETVSKRISNNFPDGFLGINIGPNKDTKNKADDYYICLSRLATYAGYITINISSPNTEGLRNFHDQEEMKKLLSGINKVIKEKADLGIAVDPDVDRLVFVCEDGVLFGEENTLVACSDFVLSKEKGSTVSNMSSTLGLKDVTERHGCEYFSSKVGEVNVVEMMKAKKAIIGGEGNGGVIYPESHYGRDALVGIVLFLSYLVEKNQKVSMILNSMPSYFMLKEKISLDENVDIDSIFLGIKSTYDEKELDTRDGIKINKNNGWIHLRKSNTEPIIRIYIEAIDKNESKKLYGEIKNIIDINS